MPNCGGSRFEQIVSKLGTVHFAVRLDVAGQYADNLLHFLHTLQGQLANAAFVISCGDPQRNKNYRAALFGSQKSDPVEARAAARYALNENPAPVKMLSAQQRTLRHVASRLQAVVRQRTRLINQSHLLLTSTFPELALLVKDIASGWVLTLCERYPTAKLLAAASPHDLGQLPYLPEKLIAPLLEHARTAIASLEGDTVAELVRDQVSQLRDVRARQLRLEKTLVDAYRRLPDANHLDSIPGIGDITAAILTAFIRDIDRFETPNQLVAYFGAMPIEVGSGVDREGKPRAAKRYIMSRRGNDLVRRYLWMAALSAVRYNPAVRALYARRCQTSRPESDRHWPRHAQALASDLRHLEDEETVRQDPLSVGHAPHTSQGSMRRMKQKPSLATPEHEQAAGLTLTAEPKRRKKAHRGLWGQLTPRRRARPARLRRFRSRQELHATADRAACWGTTST